MRNIFFFAVKKLCTTLFDNNQNIDETNAVKLKIEKLHTVGWFDFKLYFMQAPVVWGH